MAKKRKIPWEKIRLRYVTTPGLSLAEIEREFGIDYGNLHRRCKREQWREAREQFVAETTQAVKEQTREQLAAVTAQNVLEAAEQTRSLRCRLHTKLQASLETDAEAEVAEERQIATKTSGGVVVRRETRRKRSVVDVKMFNQLVLTETALLKVLLRADLDSSQVERVIVID